MELDLTIFIPTYNRVNQLKMCIESIKKSIKNVEINYEIFIVNESTIKLRLDEKDVTILNYEKEMLPCEAMYLALLNSKGKYFMRIDDDNEIDVNLIPHLYYYIIKHRDVAFCGALGKREDGSISNPGRVLSKNFKISLRKISILRDEYDVDLVDNVYIMNPELIDVEKFHISCKFFPWSFEDGYYQLRLKKLNYRIVVLPYAETIHHTHIGELNLRQVYHYGRGKFLMYTCIFKFPFVKSIMLSIIGLLFLPYTYKTDRTNTKLLFLAFIHYLKGTKDAINFIQNNKCLNYIDR